MDSNSWSWFIDCSAVQYSAFDTETHLSSLLPFHLMFIHFSGVLRPSFLYTNARTYTHTVSTSLEEAPRVKVTINLIS